MFCMHVRLRFVLMFCAEFSAAHFVSNVTLNAVFCCCSSVLYNCASASFSTHLVTFFSSYAAAQVCTLHHAWLVRESLTVLGHRHNIALSRTPCYTTCLTVP